MDLNPSLFAFFENDFVGVGEFVNFFVGSPMLNSGTLGCSSLEDILSQEVLVIEIVEITTLSLVGELRGVSDHISVGVVPSMIVISINSFFMINGMNKYFVFTSTLFKLRETLNMFRSVVKTCSNNQSFVCIFSSIGKLYFILLRKELGDSSKGVSSGPWFDLGRYCTTLQFQFSKMTVGDSEVCLGKDITRSISDEGHFIVNSISLEELHEGCGIDSTYEILV